MWMGRRSRGSRDMQFLGAGGLGVSGALVGVVGIGG